MITRTVIGLAALVLGQVAIASCPDFLDQDMRRLHSAETVNICSVAEDRPVLIVNTASHCGFTPQFKSLEAVHQKYGQELAVIGFASNDFNQEAKSEAAAAEVCFVNNGVTFTMVAPSAVRGANANAVFVELGERTQAPNWNFNKYLVSADGESVQYFGSRTNPTGAEMTAAIEAAIAR